jgi:hypothetical protein
MEKVDSLADKHNVSLVLRFVLDRFGQLQQGEVVATAGGTSLRFDTWEAMTPVVQRILQQVWDEVP